MIKKTLLTITMALFIAGCSTQTFYVKENYREGVKRQDDMQTFFIYGIGQEKELNAAAVCGGIDKVAKVQTEFTVLNWLLGFVTLGIYTPRQARVFCDTSGA